MILSLKILRGINLMAMDTNLIAANSSDPYCKVYVNGKKIGWTPTQYATLSPVFGGPMSTFRIEDVGGMTEITIQIFDYDELSADDPMGSVTFYVRYLLKRAHKDHYPNFWCTVTPPKGYENTPAGRLQIRLLEVNEMKKDSLAKPVSLATDMVSVSAGPRLGDIPKASLRDSIVSARTPVILHVYDVGASSKVRNINSALPYTGIGGIFHGGIEVYGREYSFGGSRNKVCGIFSGKPAGCPMHTYRESVYLGDCSLTREQVIAVLRRMKPEWMAPTYNLLRKNCCTFSNELAIELGVGSIPDWVISLADIAAGIHTMMGKDLPEDIGRLHEMRTTWRSLETKENQHKSLEDMTLEYIMAVRLQRKFRARQEKRMNYKVLETNERHCGPVQIRRATVNKYAGQGFETTHSQIRRATAGQGFEVDS